MGTSAPFRTYLTHMSIIKYIFTPNYVKYEGLRPVNIYLLIIQGVVPPSHI